MLSEETKLPGHACLVKLLALMKHEILTICEFASNHGGKLSIIGVQDIFNAKQAPVRVGHLFVVFRVRFDASEAGIHTVRVSIVDPDGRPIVPPMVDAKTIRLAEDSPGCIDTGIMDMCGLLIPKFGEYSVELVVDDVPLASQPLYLLRAP